MIYGAWEDIERYRGLYDGLDVLIDWAGEHDPAELPLGTTHIQGDDVFANVMAPTTRPAEGAHYETHRRYLDVQLDLAGREAFLVAQGPTTPVEAYHEDDDFELVDAEQGIAGDLDEGRFAIFVPGEPHLPTLVFPGDGPRAIRKVCFKVRVA